ncbi:hypothetical protein F3J38_00480 [Pantoea sp. Acro-805]|uniref:Glycosyltransferase n=1 Tax=Candidatus Pantoea formicae TaxID=2608355 RepID=A0ABX0QT52_9GAMM|nr:hypothetical protein [Pantoea formicae]MDF7649026.1 hypothetical protein [Erwiniaceae bacterium L1_54_3]NIE98550.1 hypothetical protein [Pantoea formicae]
MRTIMTVVLSHCFAHESPTLNSLMKSECLLDELLIINNGVGTKDIDKDFIHNLGIKIKKISVRHFLDVRPLSWIYNGVLNEYTQSDRFIFFSDEFVLESNYIHNLNTCYSDVIDLQIPNIRDGVSKQVIYPRLNKFVQKIPDGMKIDSQYTLLSINSGLVIYRSLIDKFAECNMEVFDNRFALYGVDYNFFNRLEMLKKEDYKICVQVINTIESSVPEIEEQDGRSQEVERLYDRVLSGKYYSKNKFFIYLRLLRISFQQLIRFKFSNLELIFKIFAQGKHPRC